MPASRVTEQAARAPDRGLALQPSIDALYGGQIRMTLERRAYVDQAPDRGAGPALARRPAALIPR